MSKIRIAVVGVGSCASSLIQGVEFYSRNPKNTVGLTYVDIGGYKIEDIQFVLGFDVDVRKVGQDLSKAIYAKPNCNMQILPPNTKFKCIEKGAKVYRGPTLDGIAKHMRSLPENVTFVEDTTTPILTSDEFKKLLKSYDIDVLLNYLPVGSDKASKFYIENALKCGVNVVNCMPSFISTEDAKKLEAISIKYGCTIVGSDMRSQFGASRLSEILQGDLIDAGLTVTQHIQMNMAAGSTQGQEAIINGRTANTDFLNMADKSRLYNKHISKENVLKGQNIVRDKEIAGMTMFAGPSLTVFQKPGGEYLGTDNKIANLDIVAFGWGGARYELTCRLSVQDSNNSAGIVADAIRFCRVANEMEIVGYLRGPSAWTQKTPPVQMTTAQAKYECDSMARREYTELTQKQVKSVINPKELDYTFQDSKTDYE